MSISAIVAGTVFSLTLGKKIASRITISCFTLKLAGGHSYAVNYFLLSFSNFKKNINTIRIKRIYRIEILKLIHLTLSDSWGKYTWPALYQPNQTFNQLNQPLN